MTNRVFVVHLSMVNSSDSEKKHISIQGMADQALVLYNAMLKSESFLPIVQKALAINVPLKEDAFSCEKELN